MKVVGFIYTIGAHQAYWAYMEPYGTYLMCLHYIYTYLLIFKSTHSFQYLPTFTSTTHSTPYSEQLTGSGSLQKTQVYTAFFFIFPRHFNLKKGNFGRF